MVRKPLAMFVIGAVCLTLATLSSEAGETGLKKHLHDLNQMTGNDVTRGALQELIDKKDHAKELLKAGLPAAEKKDLTYNGALILGLAAAELKDMKTAEVYFRVCMEKAAKLQSLEKLKQSYGLLIELNYDYKNYADSARLCQELLKLNTDDNKDRIVIQTMSNRFGEVEFREPQEGFKTAQRMKPYVFEIQVKSITKLGKYDQALAMVDKELKVRNEWLDQHLKAWVLREANKLEDSATIYESIIKDVEQDRRLEQDEKDTYSLQYRYEVSNVYVDLKKIDEATEHLETIIKKRPTSPVFYNDLGFIWADNNVRLDDAEKYIRKALQLDRDQRKKNKKFDPDKDQDSGAYLDSLGWVLYRQKKTKEAKKWLQKAIEDKNAQHIEIFDHLGDVCMTLGEREAAIDAWEKGLKHVTDTRRDKARKASVEQKLEKAKTSK